MGKWLKRIGIALGVLVVLAVVVGLLLPSEYSVERSVTIGADPERIHGFVGDLERWPEWTPWLDMDPTIQTVYGENTSGVGASQSWSGESGSGELTITGWDVDTGVLYDMSFDEGKYMSVGSISYEQVAGGTKVTWSMEGESKGIITRYFGVLMDAMVGPAFEDGLGKLKTRAEMPGVEREGLEPARAIQS